MLFPHTLQEIQKYLRNGATRKTKPRDLGRFLECSTAGFQRRPSTGTVIWPSSWDCDKVHEMVQVMYIIIFACWVIFALCCHLLIFFSKIPFIGAFQEAVLVYAISTKISCAWPFVVIPHFFNKCRVLCYNLHSKNCVRASVHPSVSPSVSASFSLSAGSIFYQFSSNLL